MFKNISKKITNSLLRENIIEYDSQEIYQFGMEQMFSLIFNIVSVVIIGALFNEIYRCILFASAFAILREYSGGCHASTSRRCYLYSMLSVATVLSVMKLIEISSFVCVGLFVLSGGIILFLSPVESINKPLDDIEGVVYRRRAMLIWCAEISVAIVLMVFGYEEISECIIMAHLLLSIALIIGHVQLKNRNV